MITATQTSGLKASYNLGFGLLSSSVPVKQRKHDRYSKPCCGMIPIMRWQRTFSAE
jgi:hypothetical protein